MEYLPQEIILDILSSLPVKSVLRFKCVCKSWCSLISEPQFVRTHLNRAITDITIGSQRVLIPGAKTLKSIDYEAPQNNGDNVCTVLDLPWSGRGVMLVGSCHGMVCIKVFDAENIVLCNPCTREFRELPTATSIKYNNLDYHTSCGLGYDSYADDYKFVVIVHEYRVPEIKVEVFSLRSNSWRRIIHQDIPPPDDIVEISGSGGVSLNGALHWIASCKTCDHIICFDLATELFQKMLPLPPRDQGNNKIISYYDYNNLILLGGCLSVSDNSSSNTGVWVMKEYGVEASWTKLFNLNISNYEPMHRYLRPLCISMNGQLIVDVDEEIVIYNPKYQNSRMLHSGTGWLNGVIQYTESLVSPNGIVKMISSNIKQ